MNPSPMMDPLQALVSRLRAEMAESCKSSKSLLRSVVVEACRRIGSAESSFLVPSADESSLSFLVSVNEVLETENPSVPIDQSIAGYAYTTGQTMAVTDVSEEAASLHYRKIDERTGLPTRSYLAVPIMQGEEAVAVLTFVNRSPGRESEPYTPEELESAQTYAELAAVAYDFYRHLSVGLERANRELFELEGGEGSDDGAAAKILPTRSDRLTSLVQSFSQGDREFLVEWIELFSQYRISAALSHPPDRGSANE